MWILTSPTIPISVVENKWFIQKEKLLKDSIQVPCRQTIDNRMNEIYQRLKNIVKAELLEAEKITISLDVWTKKNFLSSFLGILASFYSASKKTKVVLLLDVKKITTIHHCHEDIQRELQEVLDEYDIPKEKILFAITDSGSNMVAAFRDHTFDFEDPQEIEEDRDIELQDIPRLGCMIHALLLCIKDFSEKIQNQEVIKKIQTVVTKFSHSHVLSAALQQSSGRVLLKLSRTRWNILYLVIKRILEVKRELKRLLKDNDMRSLLTAADWNSMEQMAKFLEPFHRHTDMCATDTVSLFSEGTMVVKDLLAHLEQYQESDYAEIAMETAERIKNTFWNRRAVITEGDMPRLRLIRETLPVSFDSNLFSYS